MLVCIFAVSTIYTSCQRTGESPPPPLVPEPSITPTFSEVYSIFKNAGCLTSGCHNGSNAPNMSSQADAYLNLVEVNSIQAPSLKRVKTNNAASSYLINKMEGSQSTVGGSGTAMPPGGTRPSSEIQKVKDWINNGAKNN